MMVTLSFLLPEEKKKKKKDTVVRDGRWMSRRGEKLDLREFAKKDV